MPYKDRKSALERYYRTRDKRLKYQRRYDKEHKKIKQRYDRKRRKLKNYNLIKRTQQYSIRVHFPKLMKKYGGCQICNSKEKLEIHHKRYDTKKLSDCLLLCQECHKKLHRKN